MGACEQGLGAFGLEGDGHLLCVDLPRLSLGLSPQPTLAQSHRHGFGIRIDYIHPDYKIKVKQSGFHDTHSPLDQGEEGPLPSPSMKDMLMIYGKLSHEQLRSCIVEKELEIQRLEQTIRNLQLASSPSLSTLTLSIPTTSTGNVARGESRPVGGIREWISSIRQRVRPRTRSVGHELDNNPTGITPPTSITKHRSCLELGRPTRLESACRRYPEFSSSFDSKRNSREPSLINENALTSEDGVCRSEQQPPGGYYLSDADCMEIYGVPRVWLSLLPPVDRLECSRRHLLTARQHRFNLSQFLAREQ